MLKRGGDIFEVRHPVEFKQGEIVEVVSGNISRALEGHLKVLDDKQKPKLISIQPLQARAILTPKCIMILGKDYLLMMVIMLRN